MPGARSRRARRAAGMLLGGAACLVLLAGTGGLLLAGHAEAARAAFEGAQERMARTREAARERAARETLTTQAIGQGMRMVADAEAAAAAVPLPGSARQQLARSRLALAEAQALRRRGADDEARRAALDAVVAAHDVTRAGEAAAARYTDAPTVARWRQWMDETRAWSRRTGRAALVVSKADRRVTLFVAGRAVQVYAADLGTNWIADKLHAGDAATPEGRYRIVARNGRSQYHRALLLDYPNAEDRVEFARAKREGRLPASATPGGLIEIHGEGGRNTDWTLGCVALSNPDMEDLFGRVGVGTPVTIVGATAPVAVGPSRAAAIAPTGGAPDAP